MNDSTVSDRRTLSLSGLISVGLHLALVFGVLSFIHWGAEYRPPKLDVTLVAQPTQDQVAQAQLLAQAAQSGESIDQPVESAGLMSQRADRPVIKTQGAAVYHVSKNFADDALLQSYAHHSKRRIISASTYESRDAGYLAYWRDAVEREGTKLYRENPSVSGRSGELRVLVSVAADGRLAEVQIRSSSGDPQLDNLAIEVVKAAAPFKPLPEEMSRDTDLLEIIRTWRFSHDGHLISMR